MAAAGTANLQHDFETASHAVRHLPRFRVMSQNLTVLHACGAVSVMSLCSEYTTASECYCSNLASSQAYQCSHALAHEHEEGHANQSCRMSWCRNCAAAETQHVLIMAHPFGTFDAICCMGRAGQGRAGQGRAGQGRAGQETDYVDVSPAAHEVNLLEDCLHGWYTTPILPQPHLHNCATRSNCLHCSLQPARRCLSPSLCLSHWTGFTHVHRTWCSNLNHSFQSCLTQHPAAHRESGAHPNTVNDNVRARREHSPQ